MRFSIDWRDTVRNPADIDLAAVGNLCILVRDTKACVHDETGHGPLSDDVLVSVYPLAEGIAMDWWRLFGGRDTWFRLIKHRGGQALPDVRMRFDGTAFEVECRPYDYGNPPIRFPAEATERLERADVENTLARFLERVLDRLDTQGVEESGLRIRWNRVQASRQDTGEAAFCEAAGALGVDPYTASDDDAAFIESSAARFDGEALSEFLAGMRDYSAERDEALAWTQASERRPRYQSRLPAIETIGAVLRGHLRAGERPWARGYRCARAARRALGMSCETRSTSVSALAKRLEAPGFRTFPGRTAGIRALVQRDGDAVRVHLRRGDTLFAFGRAVGDALANPPTARAVVNDLHDASRQACGRAFAAEFLAPVEEVLSMRDDGRDTPTIAREFGVSASVIERQVENAARIARACAG